MFMDNTVILLQKRFNKYKPFVFFKDNKIYKGPYTSLINRMYRRHMDLLEFKCVNIPKMLGIHYENDESYFIEYENFDTDEIESIETVIDEEKEYKLFNKKKSNCVNFSDVENYSEFDLEECLYTLCVYFILGVGDITLNNIVYNKQSGQILVVNYDENRAKDLCKEDFYFSKSPSSQKLEKWLRAVRPYYSRVAERIKQHTNEEYTLRIRMCNKYLEMFINPQHQKEVIVLKKYMSFLTKTDEIESIVTEKCAHNKCKIQDKGIFNHETLTCSGYSTSTVFHAWRVYMRKGDERAIPCVFEIFRMREVQGNTYFVNMLINKIIVYAIEDIGIANFPLVFAICKSLYFEKIHINTLYAMASKMIHSKKSYAVQYIQNMFSRDALDDTIDTNIDKFEKLAGDNVKIVPYCNMFVQRLEERSPLAIYWLKCYERSVANEDVATRYSRKNKYHVIFEILQGMIPESIFKLLRDMYYNAEKSIHPEIVVYLAVLLVLYPQKDQMTNLKEEKHTEQIHKIYNHEWPLAIEKEIVDEAEQLRKKRKKTNTLVKPTSFIDSYEQDMYEIANTYVHLV